MVPEKPVAAFASYSKSSGKNQRKRNMRKQRRRAAALVEQAGKASPPKGGNQQVKVRTPMGSSFVETPSESGSSPAVKGLVNNKRKRSKTATSFNRLNDSIDLASNFSLRQMPSSTPSRATGPASPGSSSSDEGDVLNSVDSFRVEMESSKIFTTKRIKRQMSHIDAVKRQMADSQGSEQLGKTALERILAPINVDVFMRDYWEKRLLYVPATNPRKFENLLSTKIMDKVFRNEVLSFGKDLDVTTYSDGEKQNHNIDGSRAQAHVVWDFYSNGCSIRLLHPHTHSKPLMIVMSALQEYFGCLVGANSYLTPPSSQGFAPHYDDIEAFIIQLEGRKRWRVYKPRSKQEVLPRFSSPNFNEADLNEPPVFDSILSPGDVLYFPRGFIHQAHTLHNEHSLHVTLSVYQKTAWCDLMEKVVSNALKTAIASDLDFRRGLPLRYLRQAGVFTKAAPNERKSLIQTAKQLTAKLANFVDIDSAVDELGVQFMHDALPPVLTPAEASCSVIGNGWRMGANGKLKNKIEFPPETRVRLTRANCYRLVQEDVVGPDGDSFTQVSLYYTMDNSAIFHGEEPNFLVVEPDLLPTLRALVGAYPNFTTISTLPCESEDKMYALVCDLWDHGLLVTETPPEPIDDGISVVLAGNSSQSAAEEVAESEETGRSDSDLEEVSYTTAEVNSLVTLDDDEDEIDDEDEDE